MKKIILLIALFLVTTSVKAEKAIYELTNKSGEISCPSLWSEIEPINNLKKNQIVGTNDIVDYVENEYFWVNHSGIWYSGYYSINYYTATKDTEGNIKYEEYETDNAYCEYTSKTDKYDKRNLYSTMVSGSGREYKDEMYLILPTLNNKKVKWRYVDDKEGSFSNIDTTTILSKSSGEGDWDEITEYIKKLNEKNIYTMKVHYNYKYNTETKKWDYDTNISTLNFYEVTDEETNISFSCVNNEKSKYSCNLILDYDYIPNNIKITLGTNQAEINDFEVKGAWLVTEENNIRTLEYTNSKDEYEFTDGKEIATFSIDYDGDNPKEYIESNLSAKVVSLTNNVGSFKDDEIINTITYAAEKKDFSVKNIVNPETTSDKSIYISLICLIILLSIVSIFLNKKKLLKFNKLN